MKARLKGSYTVEAAVYIPIVLFMLFHSLDMAIDFWQESREREICAQLEELDCVEAFYRYQILDEIREEIEDD